jgi:hypothetical protein
MRDRLHEPTLIGNIISYPDKNTFQELLLNGGLRPEDFSDPACRLAYQTIIDCYEQGLVPNSPVLHTKSNKRLPLDITGTKVGDCSTRWQPPSTVVSLRYCSPDHRLLQCPNA